MVVSWTSLQSDTVIFVLTTYCLDWGRIWCIHFGVEGSDEIETYCRAFFLHLYAFITIFMWLNSQIFFQPHSWLLMFNSQLARLNWLLWSTCPRLIFCLLLYQSERKKLCQFMKERNQVKVIQYKSICHPQSINITSPFHFSKNLIFIYISMHFTCPKMSMFYFRLVIHHY